MEAEQGLQGPPSEESQAEVELGGFSGVFGTFPEQTPACARGVATDATLLARVKTLVGILEAPTNGRGVALEQNSW
jgi:hypothetical protein